MNTMLQVMQLIVRGMSVVSKVEDVNLHMRLFPKSWSRLCPSWGREVSQVTILVCKCNAQGAWLRHRCRRRA